MAFLGGKWNLGRIAAAAGTFGGSEAYRYASEDGNILGKPQVTPTAAPDAQNFQYGNGPNSADANAIAANAYSTGLQHQSDQNARESAFYNQANGNFDIANAAQMRGGPQITTSLADKQAQLAALGGTNAAMGNVNQVGNQLQALGTRPMGDSYAAAQLQQGLAGGMAQQLSMARSGRSLGSGQAAMNQAAFNNSALSQQTNQAAAIARIQEQNAYNQFQAGALGQAGNAYGQGGALAGQAGSQATTIRTGNEGVQAQNAALGQNQQQINNATTGIYNNLGVSQQNLGMQANQMGEAAFNAGAQRNDNIMGAQLNANMALGGAKTAVSMANNQADDAAAAAKQNRQLQLVEDAAKVGASGVASDERQKTDIVPLELPQIEQGYAGGFVPAGSPQAIVTEPGMVISRGEVSPAAGQDPGAFQQATTIHRPPPTPSAAQSYLNQINGANYYHSLDQQLGADTLNRRNNAGFGPSSSQSSLLSFLAGQRAAPAPAVNPGRPYQSSVAPAMAAQQRTAPISTTPFVASDAHSKTRIRELESQLAALQGPPTASFAPQKPDTASLDQAYVSQGGAPRPAVDLTAAKGYAYNYKDPSAPGAVPGRQVGPMAQDLLKTAAAPAVHDTRHGLQVDTPRLTMTNTAAISELQRKIQQLEAMGGGQAQPAPYQAGLYPQTQAGY